MIRYFSAPLTPPAIPISLAYQQAASGERTMTVCVAVFEMDPVRALDLRPRRRRHF